jgi:hypothetical protein
MITIRRMPKWGSIRKAVTKAVRSEEAEGIADDDRARDALARNFGGDDAECHALEGHRRASYGRRRADEIG